MCCILVESGKWKAQAGNDSLETHLVVPSSQSSKVTRNRDHDRARNREDHDQEQDHDYDDEVFGDLTGGETPVPIPNTAVKPTRADGTNLVTSWESRSLPRLIMKLAGGNAGLFRFY